MLRGAYSRSTGPPFFHENGHTSVSSRLIAPGSRLVGFGPTRGSAKNCAIFPIASLWRLPIVALLKSEPEHVRNDVSRINGLGTLRDHVVLGHGGFYAFRDKTTFSRWLVST